jgi:CheY-like chemotaxis protein
LWLPQSATAAETGRREAVAWSPAASGTALLVDDEELVRMSTAHMLLELGYDVAEAESGEEALRMLDENRSIDLLVTDHLMPGMNGTDLIRRIKEERPDLRVLLVSGYAETEGLNADIPRLSKPFRKDELAACLAKITA